MVLLAICSVTSGYAITYTASASGNWSSSTTWGGISPGSTISGADVVVIPSGITVNLDTDVEVAGALSAITINGVLSGSDNLTVTSGNIAGGGSMFVDQLTIGTVGIFTLPVEYAYNKQYQPYIGWHCKRG